VDIGSLARRQTIDWDKLVEAVPVEQTVTQLEEVGLSQRCPSSLQSDERPLVAVRVSRTLATGQRHRASKAGQTIVHDCGLRATTGERTKKWLLTRDHFDGVVLCLQDLKRSSRSETQIHSTRTV
jgi:hypothetical protein